MFRKKHPIGSVTNVLNEVFGGLFWFFSIFFISMINNGNTFLKLVSSNSLYADNLLGSFLGVYFCHLLSDKEYSNPY